jgi:hypothetical protein
MKRRQGFIPSALEQLEGRVVLSQTTFGLSTVVSGLTPHLRALNRQQLALVAEINQAFDSFQSDYDQARATYFASLQTSPSTDASAMTAFMAYTKERTAVLAQQVISSFIQTPQGTAKVKNQSYSLKSLVSSKIIGPKPAGTLYMSLLDTIPQPGTSAPTTTLYSLSQDNAIEVSRDSVLNGVSIIKNGAFGTQKVQHYS